MKLIPMPSFICRTNVPIYCLTLKTFHFFYSCLIVFCMCLMVMWVFGGGGLFPYSWPVPVNIKISKK